MEIPVIKGAISVIVPVYNVENYLDRCLKSITTQTYSQLEIILVNDGSSDASPNICDAWAKKDDRIVVQHRDNGGAASARNSGLDIAHGEYIMFVDSDDYLSDNICEILIEKMKRFPMVDCAICGLEFVDDKGRVWEPQAIDSPKVLSGIEILRNSYLFNDNRINFVGPCAKLFRRNLWETLRFEDGLYYEDLDIAPFLYTQCKQVLCIPDIGYYYYQRKGSASHGTGTDDKRLIDSLRIRHKHILFFDQIGQREIADSICKRLFDLVITSDCNGWIPDAYKAQCMQLVKKHWYSAISHASIKDILRYSIYRFGGARIYKLFSKK